MLWALRILKKYNTSLIQSIVRSTNGHLTFFYNIHYNKYNERFNSNKLEKQQNF